MKKIEKAEMKALKGGSTRMLFSCTTNLFECYFTKSECFANCPNPTRGCRIFTDCP